MQVQQINLNQDSKFQNNAKTCYFGSYARVSSSYSHLPHTKADVNMLASEAGTFIANTFRYEIKVPPDRLAQKIVVQSYTIREANRTIKLGTRFQNQRKIITATVTENTPEAKTFELPEDEAQKYYQQCLYIAKRCFSITAVLNL